MKRIILFGVLLLVPAVALAQGWNESLEGLKTQGIIPDGFQLPLLAAYALTWINAVFDTEKLKAKGGFWSILVTIWDTISANVMKSKNTPT